MLKLKPRDLKLGDAIQLSEGAYMTGTVSQITETEVHVVRPYIHCADFSYTGGVITYIGQEIVKLWKGSEREYLVLERRDLK